MYSGCNASLTLSQAALNRSTGCEAAALDPEDPRCTKLTLSGRLARTQGPATALGRAALFARHPQMRRWPASHGFEVFELRPADVWMIDFYGGGAHIPPEEYYAATPRHNVPPCAASTAATAATTTATAAAATAPPARDRSSASLARWLVYHSGWSSLGTVSVRLGGRPWSNVRSVADGAAPPPSRPRPSCFTCPPSSSSPTPRGDASTARAGWVLGVDPAAGRRWRGGLPAGQPVRGSVSR